MSFVYPSKKYNYTLTIKSLGSLVFSEVSAPEILMEPINYHRGNIPGKQQSLVRYGNITLKRGSTSDKQAFDWISKSDTGVMDRCDVTIALNGDDEKPLAEWTLTNAYPIKYSIFDVKEQGNEIAFESLELACEGIARTK